MSLKELNVMANRSCGKGTMETTKKIRPKCINCGMKFESASAKRKHKTRGRCNFANIGGKKQNPTQGMSKQDKIDLLDSIADDMPDGAYFAMAEEMGIQIEDFL